MQFSQKNLNGLSFLKEERQTKKAGLSANIDVQEDQQADKQLKIHLESTTSKLKFKSEKWRTAFSKTLSKVNQDFREALRMLPKNQQPNLVLHGFGEGSFQDKDIRVKTKYII